MRSLFLIVSILFFVYPEPISMQCGGSTGSTGGFESILLGRCLNFVNVLYKANCDIQAAKIDCNKVVSEFKKAFVGKAPCSVTADLWTGFLTAGKHPIGRDKSLFWSGTKDIAGLIAKQLGYFRLEDTLTGYVADEQKWCSNAGSTIIDEKACPVDCVVKNNSFWVAASIDFAKKASGRVTALVNATKAREGAATSRSIFMTYEVPNMNPAQVTEVRVVLIAPPGVEKYETCAKPVTLTNLKKLLDTKKIKYSCLDDTMDGYDTRLMLCYLNPNSAKCKAALTALGPVGSR